MVQILVLWLQLLHKCNRQSFPITVLFQKLLTSILFYLVFPHPMNLGTQEKQVEKVNKKETR